MIGSFAWRYAVFLSPLTVRHTGIRTKLINLEDSGKMLRSVLNKLND